MNWLTVRTALLKNNKSLTIISIRVNKTCFALKKTIQEEVHWKKNDESLRMTDKQRKKEKGMDIKINDWIIGAAESFMRLRKKSYRRKTI